jgi:hypothetical protein
MGTEQNAAYCALDLAGLATAGVGSVAGVGARVAETGAALSKGAQAGIKAAKAGESAESAHQAAAAAVKATKKARLGENLSLKAIATGGGMLGIFFSDTTAHCRNRELG